jgi:hypothetical protein
MLAVTDASELAGQLHEEERNAVVEAQLGAEVLRRNGGVRAGERPILEEAQFAVARDRMVRARPSARGRRFPTVRPKVIFRRGPLLLTR